MAFYTIQQMHLPEFEYYSPETIEEIFRLIGSLKKKATFLAGGTDVIPELKDRIRSTDTLISLKKIKALKGIGYLKKKKLTIGSLTTLAEVISSKEIPPAFVPIQEAAATLASPPIRSIATIGGNIVSAVPSADMPPILIAMRAKATLVSRKGRRMIPLEEFFAGPRISVLKKGEILKSIEIPFPERGTGACYLKQGKRGCLACAVTGVAAAVQMKKNVCKSARIVLGAVAEIPLLVSEVSEFLEGLTLDDMAVKKAAELSADLSCPISDLRAPADYRREIVRVLTIRALEKARERAWNSSSG